MVDYYDIAVNDIKYLINNLSIVDNNTAVLCEQVCEKLLKSVLEVECPASTGLLKSHNLQGIFMELSKYEIYLDIDLGKLARLQNVYFGCRYPNNSYYSISKDELNDYVDVTESTIIAVNNYRQLRGLSVVDISLLDRVNKERDYDDVINSYRMKYNLLDEDSWLSDYVRLVTLCKSTDNSVIAKFISDNFL